MMADQGFYALVFLVSCVLRGKAGLCLSELVIALMLDGYPWVYLSRRLASALLLLLTGCLLY